MSSPRALVVDDDPNNLKILAQLLGMQGVSPITLQDPRRIEAVLAEGGPIDVVFLDLELPDVTGYEVFNQLEARLGASVPIVAYTVHVSEIGTARELGFHSFLGKPLDPDRFPEQLDRILHGVSVWEP